MPTTLTDLPPELVQHIASYLPAASSITSLDLTCKSLHASISSDDYRLFRGFALTHFPSITFPALWRDATRALTTRSRAWDRKALVGRVLHPEYQVGLAGNNPRGGPPRQKIGYAPAIDSYEEWTGGTWSDRKEIVAWGAGPKVILRRRARAQSQKPSEGERAHPGITGVPVDTTWSTWDKRNDETAHEDILDLRLLRPDQRQGDDEQFIVRRANSEVTKVSFNADEGKFSQQASFEMGYNASEAMDLSPASNPLLAVCHVDSISLFPGCSQQENVPASLKIPRGQGSHELGRGRSLKFLSPTRFVLAEQVLQNHRGPISPIKVFQIGDGRGVETSCTELSSNASVKRMSRMVPTSIAPLTSTSDQMFLAGWSDGIVRLHDARAPHSVTEYVDTVDDGMIASVMSIAKESFIAGGHQNACLKLFDLRMPGSRPYSYLNARKRPTNAQDLSVVHDMKPASLKRSQPRSLVRDMNILLAIRMNPQTRTYEPHLRPNARFDRRQRYGGSIYSLSSPSPSSRTIYAGIENHVIQLDLASTDDIINHRLDHDWDLALTNPSTQSSAHNTSRNDDNTIIQLSGYNRPPPPAPHADQFISETKVELREQLPLNVALDRKNAAAFGCHVERETMEPDPWDRRWKVFENWRTSSSSSSNTTTTSTSSRTGGRR